MSKSTTASPGNLVHRHDPVLLLHPQSQIPTRRRVLPTVPQCNINSTVREEIVQKLVTRTKTVPIQPKAGRLPHPSSTMPDFQGKVRSGNIWNYSVLTSPNTNMSDWATRLPEATLSCSDSSEAAHWPHGTISESIQMINLLNSTTHDSDWIITTTIPTAPELTQLHSRYYYNWAQHEEWTF